jgi:hypothetical protein
VKRCEVGRREKLRQRFHAIDAELGEALGAHVRVECDDLHVEPAREPRHPAPDPAEADQAERFSGEFVAGEARAVPAAFLERGVGLGNRAREAEQEAERVLRRRDDGGLGRVRDDDSAPGGRVEIDVVDPHACPPDHLELRRLLDQAGVEVRATADDDRVVVADPVDEVAVRHVDIDVEALAQEVDPRLGYRFTNEDLHTETGSAYASSAAVTAAERSMSAPASAIASSRAASAVVTSKTSM